MASGRFAYTRALAAWETRALISSLSEEVVIHVAVHDEPLRGTETAEFLFDVLHEELEAPRVTDEIVEGSTAVVLFETALRGTAAQGLNVVRLDATGQVGDLVVFFRPLASLQLVAGVIGARMAERFGELGSPSAPSAAEQVDEVGGVGSE